MLKPLLNPIGRQLYWLRETTGTKRVINPRALSNTAEGAPNPGPGLEYLPIYKEEVVPDYDPRFTQLVTTEAPNDATGQVEITYHTPDKAKEEVKASIDNARRFEVQKQFPLHDQIEDIVVVLAALAVQSKALKPTPDQLASLERIVSIASKLEENKAVCVDLKAQVELGNKPDIDAAWAEKL